MTSPDHLLGALAEHLPAHIARQRWSGALEREITRVELVWHEVLRSERPTLLWTLARASFSEGAPQDFQLFLGVRDAHDQPEFLHGKERELVAIVDTDDEVVVVYDALVDPDLAVEVLHLVAPDVEVEVRRPLVLEHSNSSLVFDERHILKVFRKVEHGPNPDVEITRVLAARGVEHVLAPLAVLERDGTDLAVLREYLLGATDGWELARASVRDLLAGGLAPEDSGADFAPDAERLGAMLADLHRHMADAWGARPGDTQRWVAEMEAGLDAVAPAAATLAGFDAEAVRRRYRGLVALNDAGTEIRLHGDFHLAQVIKADAGWRVLDFEGEPARRRADRFTSSSPLRDVAGMLRSFHYVAAMGLSEWGAGSADLAQLARRWEARNREAFLGAYLATEGIGELLPAAERSRDDLLGAFELDKAVYEVGYELGHRPDHVPIPLAGVTRLLGARAGS